tara:strand:- start:76 stop:483 length:408 start_codon:yes stop_codon:yes gene_type:complete
MKAAGMGDMGPATRRRFEAGGPDVGGLEDQSQITDDQWAQIQQQQGTADAMLAGDPWSREQHHSANQGPSTAFSEKSYNQLAAKNRPPEGQNVFDPTPDEEDEEYGAGWDNQGPTGKLASADSFTHAWDYLLKGL